MTYSHLTYFVCLYIIFAKQNRKCRSSGGLPISWKEYKKMCESVHTIILAYNAVHSLRLFSSLGKKHLTFMFV